MKTLVVYASRESKNTEKVARAIAQKLGDNCVLAEAASAPPPENFDFIALGFGVYRGWPDGDMIAYMKRCRRRNVGLFMTLGAWPDSNHAAVCLGRAEGLLDHCQVKTTFVCQGAYTPEFLAKLKQMPPDSPHGWTPERAGRVAEAMKHPDANDLSMAAEQFAAAVTKAAAAPPRPAPPVKSAIVLAVFGSAVPTAAAAYRGLEQALRRDHPDTPVVCAYTSGMVRRKLNESMPSVGKVLKQLLLEGFTRVRVVAGLLSVGEEYHKLLSEVSAFERSLAVSVTKPPLSDLPTLRRFVSAVAAGVPRERKPGETVLFMGHGNHDGRADFQYLAAASVLAALDKDFKLACVEGNPAFAEAVGDGLSPKVWLMPLMLAAGDHAVNDLAGDGPGSWRSDLTSHGHECVPVLRGLGEIPQVAAFFAGQIPKDELM